MAVRPDDRPAAAALVEAAVDVHGADAARGTLPAALKIKYFLIRGAVILHRSVIKPFLRFRE